MDDSFRPDATPISPIEKKKEYSFDEGVAESLDQIKRLFETLDRDVFVVINGSGINVGKTALTNALQKRLGSLGIDSLETSSKTTQDKTRKVVFLTRQNVLWKNNENYRDAIRALNPDLTAESYGDLYVGIYRPDRKFPQSRHVLHGEFQPVADIMICNEKAKDNLGKLK